jgi:hypothetical protein
MKIEQLIHIRGLNKQYIKCMNHIIVPIYTDSTRTELEYFDRSWFIYYLQMIVL